MDFNAELARFKPDPALANWCKGQMIVAEGEELSFADQFYALAA